MITSLMALQWTALSGLALMGGVVVAAFLAALISELRRVPATSWQPSREWYGRTPTAAEVRDVRTLVLGMTPAAVEAEIQRWATTIPDQPA